MAKKPVIGKMNKRVTFRNPVKEQDDQGGHSEAYADLLSCYAFIVDKSGRRVFDGGYDTMVNSKDIYVYQQSALNQVNKDTRIIYEGKEYSIDAQTFIEEIKHVLLFKTTGL